MKEKLQNKKWYPYAAALCIAVVLYVILAHLSEVIGWIGTFLGYFSSIFLGCVLAYLLNPLAKFYQRTLFQKTKKTSLGWGLSVALALVTLFLFLVLLLGILIPQLIGSISTLIDNMDSYLNALLNITERLGLSEMLKLDELVDASGDVVNNLLSVVKDNMAGILSASISAGKGIIDVGIALILAVYLLSAKSSLKSGLLRLLRALLPKTAYRNTVGFLWRCDTILVQYVVFSLLDAAIVGCINAVFMLCLGMQYVGLVSLVVGVTNLIPTFGPVIGGVIGGFILLLVNPMHALLFILFTLVLQFFDGYIIKPKLFGNSLGVSGVLILAAVIVCGNMFGVVGMLLAIPLAAILDFTYKEVFLPELEKRRAASGK